MASGANYLTAIVYTQRIEPGTKGQFLKYHNIRNVGHIKAKFINDMKKRYPSAEYVNFYWKLSKEFYERIYII